MIVLPKDKEREKLLETLPLFWGDRMTKEEFATVIAGPLDKAERILKKHGLMWKKPKKYRKKK